MRNDLFNAYFVYIYNGKWKDKYANYNFLEKVSDDANNKKVKKLIEDFFEDFKTTCKVMPKPLLTCFVIMLISIIAMIIGMYINQSILAAGSFIVYIIMLIAISKYTSQFNKNMSVILIKTYMDNSITPFKMMLKQLGLCSKSKIGWMLAAVKKEAVWRKIWSVVSLLIPIISAYFTNKSTTLNIDETKLVFIIILVLIILIYAFWSKIGAKAQAKAHYIEDLEYILAEIDDELMQQFPKTNL